MGRYGAEYRFEEFYTAVVITMIMMMMRLDDDATITKNLYYTTP